ncbi:MAG TPA: metallophosphoesterase [Bryobacteraceae bacterium]|nr:metallophosphoesterase [Bryobacteraceae bacterium]
MRLRTSTVSVVLLFAANICALAATTRDWEKFPAVIQRPAPTTLYALGDIHGDYLRLLRLLAAARIVANAPSQPGQIEWSAGSAMLVVTGDMIDKGPRPVDVLHLLMALRVLAHHEGGEVILLAGNHEAEFLAGPDPGKAADFIADLVKNDYKPNQVAACHSDLGEFLCRLPFAAKVGDWFFSHAGNTDGRTLAQLNSDLHSGVSHSGFASKQLVAPDSLLEARLGDGNTWFDSAPPGERVTVGYERQLLAAYAHAVGAQHIVQGHQHGEVRFADGVTRRAGEMFQRWGLLFLIDVGMSQGVGDSHGSVLRITNGKAEAICANGATTVLWMPSTAVDVGRAPICNN